MDRVHGGASDSSVMYIPACPLTEDNAKFLARQRAAFIEGKKSVPTSFCALYIDSIKGVPCPDFGGGEGESNHVGRPLAGEIAQQSDKTGLRAFGLMEWDSTEAGLSSGQREAMDRANKALGFYE